MSLDSTSPQLPQAGAAKKESTRITCRLDADKAKKRSGRPKKQMSAEICWNLPV